MLKRITVFGLLAFFLVLNSGMLLCSVHCCIASMVTKPQLQMAGSPCKMHCSKCTQQNKNQDCSKKHGNLSIKENIQPGYSIRMHMPLLTMLQSPFLHFNAFPAAQPLVAEVSAGKAPPGIAGISLTIRYRNLLI